ncbi:MAG TPA: protein phosphatase 2C domain-containing protein [Gallionella sp.]|nr:protein phosphatase 2C domain-containing protein [Gallionella sp.]
MNFTIHQASHIGNRRYNQDRVAYVYNSDAVLLVLADGMGGHQQGEVAAALAIETFTAAFSQLGETRIADPKAFLADTMRHAHERIMQIPRADKQSVPGTTCVAALVQDDRMYWGHAGDSRLYLLRDGAVLTKTRDHSIVQQWCEWGMISVEEARTHPKRNQITNCLGGSELAFFMESGATVELQPGDVLLLGSDGLWGPFTDRELAEAFASRPVVEVLDSLIERALEREAGQSDNITGLAVRWGDGELASATGGTVCRVLDIA